MGGKTNGFLDRAYDLKDSETTREFYGDWAATYESEVLANGYATPRRSAEALAAHAADKTAPLLDLGCGTGLSGEAFQDHGFTTIDGTDFSREMLDYAARKYGVYRALIQGDLNNPLPVRPGDYANAAAVGVFSPSHAPAAMIDKVLDLLPVNGCFVFSLNDHALSDPSYEQRVESLNREGQAVTVFHEYGDHLPGVGLKSSIYVLKKL